VLFAVLEVEPRTACIPGKHSTAWTTRPAPGTYTFCGTWFELRASHLLGKCSTT
jgi:hypothetical protein